MDLSGGVFRFDRCWIVCFRWILILGGALIFMGAPFSLHALEHAGRSYVDVRTVAKRLGMAVQISEGGDRCVLNSRWSTIKFDGGHRSLKLNDQLIYLGFPVLSLKGNLYLADADYRHVVQAVLTPQTFRPRPLVRRIVIDPGHGGRDSGARNDAYRLQEKVLALEIAEGLAKMLRERGYEVFLTRERDDYVALADRSAYANRVGADLFVSLHFNAAVSTSASGYETFALTPQFQGSTRNHKPSASDAKRYSGNGHDALNTLAAYHLQRSLIEKLGGPDRGVRRARFMVLKGLECPGVLVELGFLSHDSTARVIRKDEHRNQIVRALLDGIVDYRNRLYRIRNQ